MARSQWAYLPGFSEVQPSSILVLTVLRDPLPPRRADVLTLLGKELPRHGITSVLVGQYGERTEPSSWPADRIYGVGRVRGMVAALMTPLWDMLGLWKACRANTVHFIQVRDKISSALVCYVLGRLMQVPLVYWMSYPFVEDYQARTVTVGFSKGRLTWAANHLRTALSRFAFYQFVLPNADHIFVQSEAMRDWLVEKGCAARRMTAVPMGVDTDLYNRERLLPATDARLHGRRVITYVGVLGKARASTFLLDLVDALREFEPAVLLLLAGDAASEDERSWIRSEIKLRSLQDYVLLTGWLSQEEALRYAVCAEVGLSPIPRGELFDVSSPTKLVEYLALGLAVVGNDIPDQQLVIAQSKAGLCVPMEVAAFRDAVLTLLRDDALRQQYAVLGPPYVRAVRAYDILARRVADTYREILKTHS